MVRLLIVAATVFGVSIFLSKVFPAIAAVAFVVGGFGITWMMIVCTAAGVVTYRATK